MNLSLLTTQALNGVQLGLLLFLMAAGLTLVFGILDVVNLAHGVFYMAGAYAAAWAGLRTGSFALGLLAGLAVAGLAGVLVERLVMRAVAGRGHLDQVLATFGLVLVADALVLLVFGADAMALPVPAALTGSLALGGVDLPVYRLFVLGVGVALALGLHLGLTRTRAGMLVRAAASNGRMASAMGVDVGGVCAGVFALGAVLAGAAGALVAPLTGTSIGKGTPIVVLALVVIIIGGVGSVRGALVGALLVGLLDTLGRAYLPDLIARLAPRDVASAAGPALASVLVYLVMAGVLAFRPAGLFPPASR